MERSSISVSKKVLETFAKGKIAFEFKRGHAVSNDEFILTLLSKTIGEKQK